MTQNNINPEELEHPNTTESEVISDESLSSEALARFRIRPVVVKILLLSYFVCVLVFTYLYWMRPVRADQFVNAYNNWRAVAEIYGIPLPKDNRWGW